MSRIKAICILTDPKLMSLINEHPLFYKRSPKVDSNKISIWNSDVGSIRTLPNLEISLQYLIENGYINCSCLDSEEESYKLFRELVNYNESPKIGKYYKVRHYLTGETKYVKRTQLDQFRGKLLLRVSKLSPKELIKAVIENKIKL